MEIAVVRQTFDRVLDVDQVIRVHGAAAHHFLVVKPWLTGFPAVNVKFLRRLKFHHGAQLPDAFLLGLDEMIAPSGMLGVHIRAAEVFLGNGFADGGFDHGRAGQKCKGQLFNHDRFRGQIHHVGAAGRVSAGRERVLFDAFGRHAAHVVKHGSEMTVVGEAAELERQIDSAGVGDINAGEAALLGDGLGAHVLFQRDRKIGPRGIAVFVGENHAVFSVNGADARDHAAARDVPAFFFFINGAAVKLFLADLVARVQPHFKKFRAGINQHLNQVAHRFFALLGQPRNLVFPADVVGFLPMLHQKSVLFLPEFQIGFPLLFQPFRSGHSLGFFRHIFSSPKDKRCAVRNPEIRP